MCCCPGKPAENALAGRVNEKAGEGQGGRKPVFITEFCRSHAVELLDLSEVHFGGDQNTWDVAFHVVLLSKK